MKYKFFKSILTAAICVFAALLHIGQFTFYPMESILFFVWHLMLGLCLVFLYKPISESSKIALLFDLFLAALSIISGALIISGYDDFILIMQGALPDTKFLITAAVITLLSLEAARRTLGIALPIIALLFVVYALWGGNLPGLLAHRGYTVVRIISASLSDQGIYGTPIAVCASNIYLFLLFAALLNVTGADKLFQNAAIALAGSKRGGPAKMAVISSGLFGSISGSAVANVMSTGSFTIPLMKQLGYKKTFAGAVEAVASTGGQLMPPIMGAAAFILSDFTGTQYAAVCAAALLPALMYYVCLFKMVDIESIKGGLKEIPQENIPNLKQELKKSFKLILPLAVLLIFLFAFQLTPMLAVIYSSLSLLFCGFIAEEDRLNFKKIIKGCEAAGRALTSVVSACAACGIVVGMLSITGLGLKFSNFIVQLGSGSIMLSLILAMLVCIILGMGLPATAAYIICAAAVAPALIKIGVYPLAAHLFLFYFACISAITPPVAVASYAAASIAGENALKIGLMSVKLGIAGFFIPFVFVLNLDFLHLGLDLRTVFTYISAFVVSVSLSIIIQGRNENKISVFTRFLFLLSIALSIQSGYGISIIGWSLFAFLFFKGRKKS